jgi:hypothetical protein
MKGYFSKVVGLWNRTVRCVRMPTKLRSTDRQVVKQKRDIHTRRHTVFFFLVGTCMHHATIINNMFFFITFH